MSSWKPLSIELRRLLLVASVLTLQLLVSITASIANPNSIEQTIAKLRPDMRTARQGTFSNEVAEAHAKLQERIFGQLDNVVKGDEQSFYDVLAKEPKDTAAFLVEYISSRKMHSAVPTLRRLFDKFKSEPFFPSSILKTIASLSGVESRPLLLAELRDSNIETRTAAIKALQELPYDRDTVLQLGQVLAADPDYQVRGQAAWALAEFPSTEAKWALKVGMDHETSVVNSIKQAQGLVDAKLTKH